MGTQTQHTVSFITVSFIAFTLASTSNHTLYSLKDGHTANIPSYLSQPPQTYTFHTYPADITSYLSQTLPTFKPPTYDTFHGYPADITSYLSQPPSTYTFHGLKTGYPADIKSYPLYTPPISVNKITKNTNNHSKSYPSYLPPICVNKVKKNQINYGKSYALYPLPICANKILKKTNIYSKLNTFYSAPICANEIIKKTNIYSKLNPSQQRPSHTLQSLYPYQQQLYHLSKRYYYIRTIFIFSICQTRERKENGNEKKRY